MRFQFGHALFQVFDFLEKFFQPIDVHHVLQGFPARQGGNADHNLPWADIAHYAGFRHNNRVVAHFQVIRQTCLPGDDHAIANRATAGNPNLGDDQAIFANRVVVADHHEVVDFSALFHESGPEVGTVDGGAGADFHVVLQDDRADGVDFQDSRILRGHLAAAAAGRFDATRLGRDVTEAVRTNTGVGVQNDPVANHHAIADPHAGIHQAVFLKNGACANRDMRQQNRTGGNFGVRADIRKRADGNVRRNQCGGLHNGGGMNAVISVHRLVEDGKQRRQSETRTLNSDIAFQKAFRHGDSGGYHGRLDWERTFRQRPQRFGFQDQNGLPRSCDHPGMRQVLNFYRAVAEQSCPGRQGRQGFQGNGRFGQRGVGGGHRRFLPPITKELPVDYTGEMSRTPDFQPEPQPDSGDTLRVAVIGGGAGGFFSAVNIAEKNPCARVTIFEAAPAPLRKVLISGGGRCNLTHACFEPARLAEFYPRGGRELRSLFARFQPRDTIRWFERRGLPLKTEADGRVFPVSDSSQSVIDVLLEAAHRHGVRLRTGVRVTRIKNREGGFELATDGKCERFDVCVLSTGYSPPGWRLAEELGHTVLPPVPSLFPFTIASPVIAGLQGISLPQATGRLRRAGENGGNIGPREEGALLVTHTGLSGPLIYRLSARSARELAEARYQAGIRLDLLPDQSDDAVRVRLGRLLKSDDARKKLGNTRFDPIPQRLWLSLLESTGLDLEQRADTINAKALNRLTELLKRLDLPITGKSPSKEEFVSCGGVSRKEVDFRTMQSRRVPNLYFAGEILDIDGLTGGFNFQACWSAGWVISETLA